MPKDVMTGEDIFNAGFASAFEEAKAMPVFDKLAANLGLNTEAAPVAMPVFDKLAANLGLTEEAPATAPEAPTTLFEELLAKEAGGKMDWFKAKASGAAAKAKAGGKGFLSALRGKEVSKLKAEKKSLEAGEPTGAREGLTETKKKLLKERLKTWGARGVAAGGVVAAHAPFVKKKKDEK